MRETRLASLMPLRAASSWPKPPVRVLRPLSGLALHPRSGSTMEATYRTAMLPTRWRTLFVLGLRTRLRQSASGNCPRSWWDRSSSTKYMFWK